jgi:hypothetical protein
MHSIRLREPWQPIERSEIPPKLCDSLQDCDRLGSSVLYFSRSFNRPTGLAPGQSILLAFQPSARSSDVLPDIAVCLNGAPIQPWIPTPPCEEALLGWTEPKDRLFQAESHLDVSNRLVVAILLPNDTLPGADQGPQDRDYLFTDLVAASLLILEEE